ncbi:MAG: PIN domain-containing protein [Campylobacterota bacterium]|nr:PIN domain-containing protein [Campylobacterota bacterium]
MYLLEQLNQLLQQVNILDFTQKEAKESAQIRASLEKIGRSIGPMDILIAGCARANNHTLVTRNLKEFERVDSLKLANWY